MIEVSDDGRGLDRDKIVRRAVERGIFTAEEAIRLNETEALQLIFTPGFSTADEITEISGRGVGLDVVKSALENMKGFVEIDSEAGRGTTFRLLVPLTLASIQALLSVWTDVSTPCRWLPSSRSRASPKTISIASTITKYFSCGSRC